MRIKLFKRAIAAGTAHLRAHDYETTFCVEQMGCAATNLQRSLGEIARFQDALRIDRPHDHVNRVLLEAFELSKMRNRNQLSINIKGIEALLLSPVRHIAVKTFARFDQRREYLEYSTFGRRFHPFHDRGDALFFDRQITVRAKLGSGFCKKQSKKMINFSDGCDRRFTAAARHALLDGNAWRQAFDKINI